MKLVSRPVQFVHFISSQGLVTPCIVDCYNLLDLRQFYLWSIFLDPRHNDVRVPELTALRAPVTFASVLVFVALWKLWQC